MAEALRPGRVSVSVFHQPVTLALRDPQLSCDGGRAKTLPHQYFDRRRAMDRGRLCRRPRHEQRNSRTLLHTCTRAVPTAGQTTYYLVVDVAGTNYSRASGVINGAAATEINDFLFGKCKVDAVEFHARSPIGASAHSMIYIGSRLMCPGRAAPQREHVAKSPLHFLCAVGPSTPPPLSTRRACSLFLRQRDTVRLAGQSPRAASLNTAACYSPAHHNAADLPSCSASSPHSRLATSRWRNALGPRSKMWDRASTVIMCCASSWNAGAAASRVMMRRAPFWEVGAGATAIMRRAPFWNVGTGASRATFRSVTSQCCRAVRASATTRSASREVSTCLT